METAIGSASLCHSISCFESLMTDDLQCFCFVLSYELIRQIIKYIDKRLNSTKLLK